MAGDEVVGTLRVLLTANSADYETALNKSSKATTDWGKNVDKVGTSAATFGTAVAKTQQPLMSMSGVMTGAVAGAAAAVTARLLGAGMALAQFGAESLARGSQMQALNQSFTSLSGGADQASESLSAMRRGSMGLVDDMALMQAGNKAMLLGLGLSSDQMGDLAETATVLGRAMGQGATKSFDDLITALGRSSPMILDNLGLSVKVGEANEAYADKIGKTVLQLTDAEKKQAFMNAAMDAARVKINQMGDVQLTAAEAGTKLWTAIRNLADSTATLIVSNPVVTSGINRMSTAMDTLDVAIREGPNAALVRYQQLMIGSIPKVAELNLLQDKAGDSFRDMALGGDALFAAMEGTTAELEKSNKSVERANELAQIRNGLFGTDTIKRANDLAAVLGDVSNVSKLTADKKRELHEAVSAAIEVYRTLGQTAPDALIRIKDATLEDLTATNLGTRSWTMFTAAAEDQGVAIQNIAAGLEADGTLRLGNAQATAEAREEAEELARVSGGVLAPAIQDSSEAIEDATTKTKDLGRTSKDLGRLADAFASLAQISGGSLGSVVQQIGMVINAMRLADEGTQNLKSGFQQLRAGGTSNVVGGMASMAAGIAGAVGAMDQATQSSSKAHAALGGMATGAQIGTAIMPGLGTAVGAAAGAVIGFARAAFGVSKEVKEARESVLTFEDSLISMLSATQLAEAGGERWAQVTIGVRDAYIATGRSSEEAEAAVARMWESSREGPEAAQAAIEEVNAVLAENQVLNEELEQANFTWEELQNQAEEYGVDLAALGPQFASAKLNEKAASLITFLERARNAGADWGTVMMGTRDEIGELIGEARRMGIALPENMRPFIEDLFESGNLLDENGNKIEDISGLTFTEPLEIKVGNLVDAIRELIDTMAQIPRRVDTEVHRRYTESGDRGDSNNDPGFSAGTMGRLGRWFGNFPTSGFATTLHGAEAVVTRAQAPSFAMDALSRMSVGRGGGDSSARIEGLINRLEHILPITIRDAVRQAG